MTIEQSKEKAGFLEGLALPFNQVNKWVYVLSGTLFLGFFLVIYQPFDLPNTFFASKQIDSTAAYFTISEVLVTFLSLAISQFYLREKLFKSMMTIKKHILLFLIEGALIVGLLPIISLFFEIPESVKQSLIQNQFVNTLFIYAVHLFILVFPFTGVMLYYKVSKLLFEKNELAEEMNSLIKENPQINLNQELNISNDKGIVELKVSLGNLLFLESSNQYVTFFYLENNQVQQKLVHNRLVNFLAELDAFKIVRCHRSYAINFHKANSIKIIQGKRYITLTDKVDLKVPVSKTYYSKIKALLLEEKT